MLQSSYLVFGSGQSPAWTEALVPVTICRALFGSVLVFGFGCRLDCFRDIQIVSFQAVQKGSYRSGGISEMEFLQMSYCSITIDMTKSCSRWIFIKAIETLINRLPTIAPIAIALTKESKLKANPANLSVSR